MLISMVKCKAVAMSYQESMPSSKEDSSHSKNDPELENSKASEGQKDGFDYAATTGGGIRSDGVRWELVPNFKPFEQLIRRGSGWKKHVSVNSHDIRRDIA
jgi:hypothetical protein